MEQNPVQIPTRKFKARNKRVLIERAVDDFPVSDEPIDMSLSSRKRALSPSKWNKNEVDDDNVQNKDKEDTDLTILEKKIKVSTPNDRTPKKKTPLATLIISPQEYSVEGIDIHFNKSLRKTQSKVEREVDDHFLRSLGWEVWKKLRNSTPALKKSRRHYHKH